MKMREYVDAIRGEGAWDRMYDSIERGEILDWEMPSIEVDGHTVHIFPGTDREVLLEKVKEEIRKALGL